MPSSAAAIPDVSALGLSFWDILLRLLCAMLIGAVIGTEREYTHRPAGMRTHMLVALGACAVMVTSQLIFWEYRPFGATPDPARLSAQVITGIGFLGAGTILKEGPTVKGLTTAASLWAVACLGVAAGGGYYAVALLGMGCIFVTLTVFEWLQKRLPGTRDATYFFSVECTDIGEALACINKEAGLAHGVVSNIQADSFSDGYKLSFKVEFEGLHSMEKMQRLFTAIGNNDCVRIVKNNDDFVGSM